MKATGIVRRIDDLGRLVVPKAIRDQLCIKEGDPFELFVGEGNKGVYFEKYEPGLDLRYLAENLVSAINGSCDLDDEDKEALLVPARALLYEFARRDM